MGPIALGFAAMLLAVSGRYGYHRDELYFIAAGHHLSWGYPDQPPLVPALARLMTAIAPGSLVVLRLPAIAAGAGCVVLTGLLARELGAGRAAQRIAAGCAALSALVLGASHLLSTMTFQLLVWPALLLLVVRIVRAGRSRLWPLAGVVAGIGLLDSDLTAFLVGGLLVGLVIAGPRTLLRSPWLWVGVVIAGAMWAPYLHWQAADGWPQLAESRAIAAGQSGTSAPRAAFLPYQLVLAGPWVAPVWIAGLVRLFRDRTLRTVRFIGWAWVALVVAFVASGGKPYYLGGMFPILFAAGAGPVVDWLRARRRHAVVIAGVVLSLPSILVTLPVLPVRTAGQLRLSSVDYDLGEQVGWPTYVDELATIYHRLPAGRRGRVQFLTSNYGEAGALERYGPRLGLPRVFSGQTGFWYWGRPSANVVVAVGFTAGQLQRWFAHVLPLGRLDNRVGVHDDEQGRPVWLCDAPLLPWSSLWPRLRHT